MLRDAIMTRRVASFFFSVIYFSVLIIAGEIQRFVFDCWSTLPIRKRKEMDTRPCEFFFLLVLISNAIFREYLRRFLLLMQSYDIIPISPNFIPSYFSIYGVIS